VDNLMLGVNTSIGSTGNPHRKVLIVFAKDYL
jgi:hypothetical protein